MKREPAKFLVVQQNNTVLDDDRFFLESQDKLLHKREVVKADLCLENALLLICQNHLFTLMLLLLQSTLLSVLPNVVFSSLDRSQLFSLDFSSLLNSLRHMTLAFDSPDLGHVRVSVDQSLVILQLRPLTSALDSAAVGSVGTPKSDVSIVRAGENVFVVGGELGGEDTVG